MAGEVPIATKQPQGAGPDKMQGFLCAP